MGKSRLGAADEYLVGYVIDGDDGTPRIAGMLHSNRNSVTLELPLWEGETAPYDSWFPGMGVSQIEPPPALHFRTAQRRLALSGLRFRGSTRNWGSEVHSGILDVAHVVDGSSSLDYDMINGVRSEIEGLEEFLRPKVMSRDVEYGEDRRIQQIRIILRAPDPFDIDGVPGLSLRPGFDSTAPGDHSLLARETVRVMTRFPEPRSWDDHLGIHLHLQDLVSIARWSASALTVTHALRDDDPERTVDGKDHGDAWREAHVPRAGRGTTFHELESRRTKWPLFTFDDIGQDGIAQWFANREAWRKGLAILASSLFRQGDTVEDKLMNAGVALEAIGYELAVEAGRVKRGQKSTLTFAGALKTVWDSTDCDLNALLDISNRDTWVTDFNSSYKGVKHADNSWPDPYIALQQAAQGTSLIRLWLARRLGTPRLELERRKHCLS